MNETARDYAETKRGLKNQIQERGHASSKSSHQADVSVTEVDLTLRGVEAKLKRHQRE